MRLIFFLLFPVFLSAQINRAYGVIEIGASFPTSSSTGPKFAYRTVDSSFYRWVSGNTWVKVIESSIDPDTLYLKQLSGTTAIVDGDTVDISTYLLHSDTASMLTPYIKLAGYGLSKLTSTLQVDTSLISTKTYTNRFLLKSDTAAMLTKYIERGDTASMLTNYPSTAGYGIIDGGKTWRADTTSPNGLATRLFAKTLPTSIVAGRIAVSDGSNLIGHSGLTFFPTSSLSSLTYTALNVNTSATATANNQYLIGSLFTSANDPSTFTGIKNIIAYFSSNDPTGATIAIGRPTSTGFYGSITSDFSSRRFIFDSGNSGSDLRFNRAGSLMYDIQNGNTNTYGGINSQLPFSQYGLNTSFYGTGTSSTYLLFRDGIGGYKSAFGHDGNGSATIYAQRANVNLVSTDMKFRLSGINGYAEFLNNTAGVLMGVGTDAQRPTNVFGILRGNTTGSGIEFGNGTTWDYLLRTSLVGGVGTADRVGVFDVNGKLTGYSTLTYNGTTSLNFAERSFSFSYPGLITAGVSDYNGYMTLNFNRNSSIRGASSGNSMSFHTNGSFDFYTSAGLSASIRSGGGGNFLWVGNGASTSYTANQGIGTFGSIIAGSATLWGNNPNVLPSHIMMSENGMYTGVSFPSVSPNLILQVAATNKAALPWPLQTQVQADAVTATQGGVQYETTANGIRWYNGTRKAYAVEGSFARGTNNSVIVIDANGQISQVTNFTFSTTTLNFPTRIKLTSSNNPAPVEIGRGASSGATLSPSISIGDNAQTNTSSSSSSPIAIGSNATTGTSARGIAIGLNTSTANFESIVIGRDATATADNQLVFGGLITGNGMRFDDVFFNGVNAGGAGRNIRIGNGAATGTNLAGGNVTLNSGAGTGTGTTSDLIFGTPTVQVSGATVQTLTNRWWVKGNTGYLGNNSNPAQDLDVTDFLSRDTIFNTSPQTHSTNDGFAVWKSTAQGYALGKGTFGTGLSYSGGVLTATASAPTQILAESYNRITSTSSPQTFSSTISDNLVDQGGTQATFTLKFPASPVDGQVLKITYNNAITTLTLDGNGNTIVGSAVTTGVAGSQRAFKFYTGIGWIKLY